MGCDIHMRAEVRNNGKWELIGEIFKNQYYDADKQLTDWNKPLVNEPYDGRNYNLFAILANVRNGRGFAGVKTSDALNYISEPKGYPDDMSEELKKDDWFSVENVDGHSASYFNLQELESFDWLQTFCRCGFITETQYVELKNEGKNPDNWCGDIGGDGIIKLSNEEMDDLINGIYPRNEGKQYYTRATFNPITYAECCGRFLTETIPALIALIPENGTKEDVRIVFNFDN